MRCAMNVGLKRSVTHFLSTICDTFGRSSLIWSRNRYGRIKNGLSVVESFIKFRFSFRSMNLYSLKRFDILRSIFFVLVLFAELNDVFCNILTNSYLVEFNQPTDRSIANQIARRNGFINVGPVIYSKKLRIFF